MDSQGDVLVAGGGVIGLALAFELLERGARVTLVDPGRREESATWAAGGMLSPLGESKDTGPLLDLALESSALYPSFVRGVASASRVDPGFRACGRLQVAVDEEGLERLRNRYEWQRDAGLPIRWVVAPDLAGIEAGLSETVRGGLHLAGDGLVDNRALGRALHSAVRKGGLIIHGTRVRSVEAVAERTTGVRLATGEFVGADVVVVAAGAWSGEIEGGSVALPVRPVRGQMIAFDSDRPLLRGVVASEDAYLIPRETGPRPRLLVGATVEEVGFDRATTAAAGRELHEAAARVLPILDGLRPAERWAGLRPGTPDDLPVLGPDPSIEGLFYATGHFRNGVLLAPVTARLLAGMILDGDEAPESFRPDRFIDSEVPHTRRTRPGR